MSVTASGKIAINVNTRYTDSEALSTPTNKVNASYLTNFASGSDDGEIQLVYEDEFTIETSDSPAVKIIDLGELLDAFGNTIIFSHVKALVVIPDDENANNILIGGSAYNPVHLFNDTSDKVIVQPGGAFLLIAPNAGFQVSAGSTDQLQIASGASDSPLTPVTFKIHIAGIGIIVPAATQP